MIETEKKERESGRVKKKKIFSTSIPGSQGSKIYLPSGGAGVFDAGISSSKPVPPCGSRINRFVMGAVLCDPGRKESAPFSEVHFSNANQNPRALGGSVYYTKWIELRIQNYFGNHR